MALNQKQSNSYSYPFFYTLIVGLALAGIINCLYLTYTHYSNFTNINFASFCAISKSINCDTVAQSPWAIFLGLPISLWGFIGYLFFFMLLFPLRKKDQSDFTPLWSLLFLIAIFFSFISIFFGYISSVKIKAYCLLCFFNYGISFFLLFYTWLIRRRFANTSLLEDVQKLPSLFFKNRPLKFAVFCFIMATILFKNFIPHYWNLTPPPLAKNISTGTTEEGNPWIGAAAPTLTINEYSDYLCFQCYKMHNTLRRLVAEFPDRIRLIHHNFPMDSAVNTVIVTEPFHEGSGDLAKIAIFATFRGKFWETNDLLYEIIRQSTKEIPLKKIADTTGMNVNELAGALIDPNISELLRRDIWHGMKLGITGTPTYVIGNKVYQGHIPADALEEIMQ